MVLIYLSLVVLAIYSSLPDKAISSIWAHTTNSTSPVDICKYLVFLSWQFFVRQLAWWHPEKILGLESNGRVSTGLLNTNVAFFRLLLCLTGHSKVAVYNTRALWMKQDSKFAETKYICFFKQNMLRSVQWQAYLSLFPAVMTLSNWQSFCKFFH